MGADSEENSTLADGDMGRLANLVGKFSEKAMVFLPPFLGALVVLIIGCMFIRYFTKFVMKRLLGKGADKKDDDEFAEEYSGSETGSLRRLEVEEHETELADGLDPTLVQFIMSVLDALLKVVLGIVVCGMIGIKTTSIIAIFTASTLAVGFALQGLMTDLANGIMMIIFRPFVHGDWVTIAERSGRVTELSMFRTVLMTEDGSTIHIPNSRVGIIEVSKKHTHHHAEHHHAEHHHAQHHHAQHHHAQHHHADAR